MQGLCEKRAEAFIDYRTVHKVLRRAAEGGFPYLKRRCLEFCLMHLSEVGASCRCSGRINSSFDRADVS